MTPRKATVLRLRSWSRLRRLVRSLNLKVPAPETLVASSIAQNSTALNPKHRPLNPETLDSEALSPEAPGSRV